jgi:hypothetical protein
MMFVPLRKGVTECSLGAKRDRRYPAIDQEEVLL